MDPISVKTSETLTSLFWAGKMPDTCVHMVKAVLGWPGQNRNKIKSNVGQSRYIERKGLENKEA